MVLLKLNRLLGVVFLLPFVWATPQTDKTAALHAAVDGKVFTSAFDASGAQAAVRRIVGHAIPTLELAAVPKVNGDDWFRISTSGKKTVLIEGSSNAVLLTGFDWYLKYVANQDISWDSDNVNLPEGNIPLPSETIVRRANVEHRIYGNDLTTDYTSAHWTFDKWERELDIMALKGYNTVFMTIGQDETIHQTLTDYGYSAEDMLAWTAPPCHNAAGMWQGGFTIANGGITAAAQARRVKTGQQIVERMRELDISPIMPGFVGFFHSLHSSSATTTACQETGPLTKLGKDGLELLDVLLVLALVLDLRLDTLEDADGSGIVVDLARGAERGLDDRGRGHEVVRKRVVQAALELKQVADLVEERLVARVELLVGLLGLVRRVAHSWERVSFGGCGRERERGGGKEWVGGRGCGCAAAPGLPAPRRTNEMSGNGIAHRRAIPPGPSQCMFAQRCAQRNSAIAARGAHPTSRTSELAIGGERASRQNNLFLRGLGVDDFLTVGGGADGGERGAGAEGGTGDGEHGGRRGGEEVVGVCFKGVVLGGGEYSRVTVVLSTTTSEWSRVASEQQCTGRAG